MSQLSLKVVRMDHAVVELERKLHRQLAELHQLADAEPDREVELVVSAGLPVDGGSAAAGTVSVSMTATSETMTKRMPIPHIIQDAFGGAVRWFGPLRRRRMRIWASS